MIRVYTLKQHVRFAPETIILFGMLENLNQLTIPDFHYNKMGHSRFHNIIDTCKRMFKYVDDITDCDICVMPYKFIDINDPTFMILFEVCSRFNKPLYIFYNDDNDKPIAPDSKIIKIFRTSFYKSTKQSNEYALPTIDADHFDGYLENPELTIGFCGAHHHNRFRFLQTLNESDIKTNFIIRGGFWAPEINDKKLAKTEYMSNIRENLFTFCYRGAGNFSYRFYDVMMMGRIAILVNTDCVFPFEDKYDMNEIGIIINENDDIVQSVKDYYIKNKDRLYEIQKNNRIIWEKYYSPHGFLSNIV